LADDSLPLGRAHQLASIVVKETRRAGLAVDTLVPVGDIRRYEPAVSAVDILVVAAASEHHAILSRFARLPIVMVSRGRDDRSIKLVTERGPVTIHLTIPADAGAALVWHTGSSAHVEALQQRAAARGLQFRDAQLTETNGRPVRCP
jgi:DNA polymerase (family 10)